MSSLKSPRDGNTDRHRHARHASPANGPTALERYKGAALSVGLRLLSSTWRIDCEGCDIFDQPAETRQRFMFAFWHGHYMSLFRLFYARPVIAVTNQSHRGQVIAEICRYSGMPALQLREKGTRQTLALLQNSVDHDKGLAIAVDGPLGPPRAVKRGVLHLAARLNCPIVPVAAAAERKHVMAGRWDRLEIPHFFSRVSFVIGTPLDVLPSSSRAEFGELARQLKISIDHVEDIARQRFA